MSQQQIPALLDAPMLRIGASAQRKLRAFASSPKSTQTLQPGDISPPGNAVLQQLAGLGVDTDFVCVMSPFLISKE
jgi:hypothetical protein